MTKTEVTIIMSLVIVLFLSAVSLAQAKLDVRALVENRTPNATTLEVKPTRLYEDSLQRTPSNKVIKVQFAPYGE
jgi:hypothetical protein